MPHPKVDVRRRPSDYLTDEEQELIASRKRAEHTWEAIRDGSYDEHGYYFYHCRKCGRVICYYELMAKAERRSYLQELDPCQSSTEQSST